MSRICNYCLLKKIKSKAKKIDYKIEVILADDKWIDMPELKNSVNVYVYPPHVKLTNKNKETYFNSWLAELPDKCAC